MSKNSQARIKTASSDHYALDIDKIPSLPLLLGKAAFKSGAYRAGDPLPPLQFNVGEFCIDRDHLQRYKDICGFQLDRVPATYLFVIAFPLFMRLMIDKGFPMRVMGQVHLRNQIRVEAPVPLDDNLNISVSLGKTELTSRGLEWDIDTVVESGGQPVWTCTSTFLYRCKTSIDRPPEVELKPQGDYRQWSFSADKGRRYAWVSGDFNPIHLTNVTAKLLGFRAAIAHGMWSKARCLAALEHVIPDSGCHVDVSFNKPLFLPSEVRFYSQQQAGDHQFSLFNHSGSQPHLHGVIHTG